MQQVQQWGHEQQHQLHHWRKCFLTLVMENNDAQVGKNIQSDDIKKRFFVLSNEDKIGMGKSGNLRFYLRIQKLIV